MLARRFLLLACAVVVVTTPSVITASATPQVSLPTTAVSDQSERLARLETLIEQKRKALGVPGLSLVIVKNDTIIYHNGFGLKDAEHDLAVRPTTLFPIGSVSKSFTAMAAMIAADEGLLSLDDPPKKYLPYFRLMDSDADANITIRDLLDHASGLPRSDFSLAATTCRAAAFLFGNGRKFA